MNLHSISSPDGTTRSWELQLELQAPHANVTVLMWAIFADDPRPRFRGDVARFSASTPGGPRVVPLAAMWDRLFSAIPGNQIHLLTAAPNVAHLIKSDGDGGRKWIVTRAVHRREESICWCLPFDAIPGHQGIVVLDDTNLESLARLSDLRRRN